MPRFDANLAKRRADEFVLGNVDELGRAIGLELGRRLILKTPRDTGRAAQNWNASVDVTDATTHERTAEGIALAVSRPIVAEFKLSKHTLYWTNGLPYAERLENGWSRQAPAGMVDVTIAEMKPIVERVAGRIGRG